MSRKPSSGTASRFSDHAPSVKVSNAVKQKIKSLKNIGVDTSTFKIPEIIKIDLEALMKMHARGEKLHNLRGTRVKNDLGKPVEHKGRHSAERYRSGSPNRRQEFNKGYSGHGGSAGSLNGSYSGRRGDNTYEHREEFERDKKSYEHREQGNPRNHPGDRSFGGSDPNQSSSDRFRGMPPPSSTPQYAGHNPVLQNKIVATELPQGSGWTERSWGANDRHYANSDMRAPSQLPPDGYSERTYPDDRSIRSHSVRPEDYHRSEVRAQSQRPETGHYSESRSSYGNDRPYYQSEPRALPVDSPGRMDERRYSEERKSPSRRIPERQISREPNVPSDPVQNPTRKRASDWDPTDVLAVKRRRWEGYFPEEQGKGDATTSEKFVLVAVVVADGQITETEADIVEGVIIKAIDQAKTDVPRFSKCRLLDGCLLLSCADEQSVKFLEKLFSGDDGYKIVKGQDIPVHSRIKIRLQEQVDPKLFIKRLEKQNPGLCCDSWRLLTKKTKKIGEILQFFTFGIDRDSRTYIEKSNSRLWYLLSRVSVLLLPQGEGPA